MKFNDLWPFYLSRFTKSLIKITSPFETLYYLWVWLSYTQVATILVVKNLVTLIFEIPTSRFAEKYWNKYSVILWNVLSGISMVLIPFVSSFWFILILSWLFSFFKTFYSWSDRARIWEIIRKKDPKYLTKYFWYSKSLNNLGVVFVWFLWTFIVQKMWTMNCLWIIAWLWYVLAGLILLFWKKEDIKNPILWENTEWFTLLRKYYNDWIGLLLSSKNEQIYFIKRKRKKIESLFSFVKTWFKELLKNKTIIYLFIWVSILCLLKQIWKIFWGPYFQENWFDISKLWWLYSVSGLLWILVPIIIPRLRKYKHREMYFLVIIILLWMFILWSLCLWNIPLLIVAYLLAKVIEDFIFPLDGALSVDIISKESRSVILSMRESVKSSFGIFWSLFLWVIFDNFSLLRWGVIISVLIIALWLNYAIIVKRHRSMID